MKKLWLIVPCLTAMIAQGGNESSRINTRSDQYRDMIMLIDNGDETITHQGAPQFCSSRLLSALQYKSAPILVSTSLWKNFIVRRQELSSATLIPETDEYKACAAWKQYIERINFWFDFFSKQTNSTLIENKMSVVHQINQEFSVKGLYNDPIANHIKSQFPFYCAEFNEDEWSVYNVGNYFYLLIPNRVLDDYKKAYHLDQLTMVNSPTDVSLLFFENTDRPEGDCIAALSSLFKKHNPYRWNVCLSGHGINDKWCNIPHRLISNLTVTEFKKVLNFLNDSVSTNALVYTSCYGAGDQFVHTYSEDEKEGVYNYTIVVPCLSDTISYAYGCDVKSVHTGDRLVAQDLEYVSESNRWRVKLYDQYDWHTFFTSLTSDMQTFESAAEWLTLVENIGPRYMNNIPQVRLAGTDRFIMMYPDNKSIKIDASSVALRNRRNEALTIEGNESHQFVLLDTQVISVPCIFSGDTLPKTIISVSPGEAVHHFSDVKAESADLSSFVSSFVPFGSPTFDKTILIDSFTCKTDHQSTSLRLHAEDAQIVTLKNVILQIQKDQLIRVSFQGHDGTIYGAYMYCRDNKGYLRGITPLNEVGVQGHKDSFTQAKEKAFISKSEQQKVDRLCEAFESLQQAEEKTPPFTNSSLC